ncbi:MAG: malto-oligosyltrehalose trehalohydrolase [Thermomicrobiales bacterium]
MTHSRSKPLLGANVTAAGVQFGVWAPNAKTISLILDGDRALEMSRLDDGVFSLNVADAAAGSRYAYLVDDAGPFPDPRSRFQPDGVHGSSEVIDPDPFVWSDSAWSGISGDGLVIYELHIGTMTPEGTFLGLIEHLPYLADLGITAIEILPVAECTGRWNWGYDGVGLYATSRNYGRPDELRVLVDAAHANGIGVILDVVYNHLGPDGNYLGVYSNQYSSEKHVNSWGAGLNWDGPGSEFVRQFAIDNAIQWIAEYHIDGLRLDATHAIVDDSPVHLVQALTAAARAAAGDRQIFIVAEDERRDIVRVRSESRDGEGLDAVWADDFHHEVRVLLTNAQENYYSAYSGTTSAIATAINDGFGDGGFERGTPPTPTDSASNFVFCIQNHDQIGNRPFGERLHHDISEDRYAVASTLLLFAPETPLLFMGQEFAASTPFLYFTDHPEELGRLVTQGRRKEFSGFRLFDDPELRETIPDPQGESTFTSSILNLDEREQNFRILELYRDLIRLRSIDVVLSANDRQTTKASWLTAQVVAVHRWRGDAHRLLIANFGGAVSLTMPDDLATVGRWDSMFATSPVTPVLSDSNIEMPPRSAAILQSN